MGRFADWFFRDTEHAGSGAAETRSIVDVPWVERPFNYGDVPAESLAQKTALTLGSVYAANRLLAQSISTLPLKTYRRSTTGDERVPMGTLPQLFLTMVEDGTLVAWLHRCVTSLGLRGNAYGLIISRDGFGFPTHIEWLDPALVITDDRPGQDGWLWNGRPIPRDDIVHIPWFAVAGERCGLSPIRAFARTMGIGLNAQTYASEWFQGGGFPPGTFQNTEKAVVSQEEADAIKARLVSGIRSRQPVVYGKDWQYNAISVPPEEAQFVQTMKMTTNQVAAIYGIPPEMIGGESGSSMTYANVEQQQINFVMFTLRPWLVLLETTFSALLPNRQYVRFNADALIRADLKTRWEVNKIRVDMGAANVDEIRVQEDQPPLPNGEGQKYGPAIPAAPAVSEPSNPPGNVLPMRRDANE